MVACKGTTCQYGLLDSFDLSRKIHDRFYKGYESVKPARTNSRLPSEAARTTASSQTSTIWAWSVSASRVFRRTSAAAVRSARWKTPVRSMQQRWWTALKIDPNLCNNCGRCIGTCPFKAMPTGEYGYRIYIGGRMRVQKYAHGKPLDPVFTSEEEVDAGHGEEQSCSSANRARPASVCSDTIERLGFENVQSRCWVLRAAGKKGPDHRREAASGRRRNLLISN